jgi:hypothetical protein
LSRFAKEIKDTIAEKSKKCEEAKEAGVIIDENTKFIPTSKNNPLSYFEKDGLLVVGLPRTSENNFVYIDDLGKGFSFSDLVLKSKAMGDSSTPPGWIMKILSCLLCIT